MKLFLSHDSHDLESAHVLVEHLEAHGHAVWRDQTVSGGQLWWQEVLAALRECDALVAVLSSHWLSSESCRRQFDYATALQRPRLPVQVSPDLDGQPLWSELTALPILEFDLSAVLATIEGLPDHTPLPTPLPEPPAAPPTPFGAIADVLYQPELSFEEQASALMNLKIFMDDPLLGDTARQLLQVLRDHPRTLPEIALEIDSLERDTATIPERPAKLRALARVTETSITPKTAPRLVARRIVELPGRPQSVAFAAQEALLAVSVRVEDGRSFVGWRRGLDDPDWVTSPLYPALMGALAVSPDGKQIAFGRDEQVMWWDLDAEEPTPVLYQDQHLLPVTSALSFAPDGSRLAVGFLLDVFLWEPRTGHTANAPLPITGGVYSLDYGEQGLAVGTFYAGVLVSRPDEDTCQVVRLGHKPVVEPGRAKAKRRAALVRFSPDGWLLVARGRYTQVTLWRTDTWREVATLDCGVQVTAIAFAPDGAVLATALEDGSIKLWNAGTSTLLATLSRDEGPVLGISFAADGSCLASIHRDARHIVLWGLPD